MGNDEINKLVESIKLHEGNPGVVYLDTKGNLTCGWGHLLAVGTKVPQASAEAFLKQDIANAISDFMRIPKSVLPNFGILNTVRRRVIVELIFNMGLRGVLGFRNMWACIRVRDWLGAARELLDSKWAREDVGEARSTRMADQLARGKD